MLGTEYLLQCEYAMGDHDESLVIASLQTNTVDLQYNYIIIAVQYKQQIPLSSEAISIVKLKLELCWSIVVTWCDSPASQYIWLGDAVA